MLRLLGDASRPLLEKLTAWYKMFLCSWNPMVTTTDLNEF